MLFSGLPKHCPFFLGDLDPYLIHGSFGPPNEHLDRFSRFCRVHKHDQQTDSQTHRHRPRYFVCSDRPHLAIAAMRPKYRTHDFLFVNKRFRANVGLGQSKARQLAVC